MGRLFQIETTVDMIPFRGSPFIGGFLPSPKEVYVSPLMRTAHSIAQTIESHR
jgi:hypothetical protein